MDVITVTAKTVAEAVNKALIELEVTSDKLDYEVLEKGSSGFLGIGAKPAVIRAKRKEGTEDIMKEFSEISETVSGKALREELDEKKPEKPSRKMPQPEKTESVPAPENKVPAAPKEQKAPNETEKPAAEEKAPMSDIQAEKTPEAAEAKKKPEPIENPEEVSAKAKEFLNDVFHAMNLGVTVETSVNQEEREIRINLSGDDMGILIGKRGQTLDALQYLLSLVINRGSGEYIRVRLDTENYRERRKETLETLARNIAYKVKRTRIPVALEPMNPYERRIIHSALQSDKYVLTRSEGEEPYRHVIIYLKKGADQAEPVSGEKTRGGRKRRKPYEGGRRNNRGRRGGNRYENSAPEEKAEMPEDSRPDSETMPTVKKAEAPVPQAPEVPKWRKDSEKYGNSISVGTKNTED